MMTGIEEMAGVIGQLTVASVFSGTFRGDALWGFARYIR